MSGKPKLVQLTASERKTANEEQRNRFCHVQVKFHLHAFKVARLVVAGIAESRSPTKLLQRNLLLATYRGAVKWQQSLKKNTKHAWSCRFPNCCHLRVEGLVHFLWQSCQANQVHSCADPMCLHSSLVAKIAQTRRISPRIAI